VHADHIERDAAGLSLLILPNLGAMSDKHAEAVEKFVARGGGVVASGQTSLWDETGKRRNDFALARVFGVHAAAGQTGSERGRAGDHSYLRLLPDVAASVYGPRRPAQKDAGGKRHEVLNGFEETNIIPFGGVLQQVTAETGVMAPLTYVPDFPVYPPETSWMREPRTPLPGLLLRSLPNAGRVAYLAADVDSRFGRDNLPDHFRLLSNIVRWSAGKGLPLAVTGPGLVDCHLYSRPGGIVLHLVNLTSTGTWRAPVDELVPVGPLRVSVRLPAGLTPKGAKLLVAESGVALHIERGWATFEVSSVADHEVVALE